MTGSRALRMFAGVAAASAMVSGVVQAVPASAATSHAATRAATASHGCVRRSLVLSAMPVELGPILAQEKVTKTVTVGPRTFYIGTLRRRPVVLALSGIGPVNATQTTKTAISHFRCGHRTAIRNIVFSGVAGGDYIGDVIVPTKWTLDAGKHVLGVNRRLLHVAHRVARHHPALEQTTPAGDPACDCVVSPGLVNAVKVTHKPVVEIGGAGQTTDPFTGRALPCIPQGGDVFGCHPCPLPGQAASDVQHFGGNIAPFVDPAFFAGYGAATATESSKYVVEDEETAAVDTVAHQKHVPFLGIRAVSDGGGDPLHLPGFPFEFFAYRQISADNAATIAIAVVRHLPRH